MKLVEKGILKKFMEVDFVKYAWISNFKLLLIPFSMNV